jgi:hypothetical protein
MKGTRFRGQIRSESPDTTGPILAAVHPKPPLRHTHRSVGRGRPSTAVWRSLCHGQSVRQRPRRSVGARSRYCQRCCRPAFQIHQSRLGGSVGLASGSRRDRPNPRGRLSTRTTETKLRPRHRAQLQLSISRSSRYREVYGTSSGRSARRRWWMRQSGEVLLDRRSDAPSTIDAHQEVFVLVACGGPVP